MSGVTALQALRDRGAVQPGQHVLVIGASGGVGTFAVQLAKAFGAEVTGVCSTTKVDLVRSLGADHVVDYSREDFAATGTRYDLILDIGGNTSLSRLRRALTPKGTLVIVGGETSGKWLGGSDRQVRAMVLSMFVSQKLGTFIAAVKQEDLLVLAQLAESGQLTPAVDRTFSLDEAPKAIRHVDEGRARAEAQGCVTVTHPRSRFATSEAQAISVSAVRSCGPPSQRAYSAMSASCQSSR